MKINLLLLILYFNSPACSIPQSVTEKEIFELKYKGIADSYNFKYDTVSENYCYVYLIPGENKSFIISKKSLSDKYDYITTDDIKFDSKGNYYTITSDYKPDYGTNNYFLIVNGDVVKSYSYMESYDSYVNKKDEFVFIFKEKDLYYFGYYSPESGFRQSSPYDNIRPVFDYKESMNRAEGEDMPYDDADFYHNDKGERAFIANVNGKSKIIFETSEIATDYSDINESSFTMNNNNELSYIAKKGGRFYERFGNEFVVSGSKEYDKFGNANVPLFFNEMNEPVYIGGDSVSENKTRYFLVVGNQIQKVYTDNNKSEKAADFESYMTDIKITDSGTVTYLGNYEITIPAKGTNPLESNFDQYFTRLFFVNDGVANELGYNINKVEYNDNGDMLYSGIADLQKKDNLLMLNYGLSKIIINREKFDGIYDYGFTSDNEIFYVGQNYEDSATGKKFETSLFLGNKLLSKNYNFVFQTVGDNYSILKFDSSSNYAFVTENKLDSVSFEYVINTNSGKLPFPENVSNSKRFTYISNLFYADDKLFYVGDMKTDPVTNEVTKEIFYDNKTLGKTYNAINDLNYDEDKDQITFFGTKGSKIYLVTVKL